MTVYSTLIRIYQRMSMLDGNKELVPPNDILSDLPFNDGKTFQKRSVSSPAPVTIL